MKRRNLPSPHEREIKSTRADGAELYLKQIEIKAIAPCNFFLMAVIKS